MPAFLGQIETLRIKRITLERYVTKGEILFHINNIDNKPSNKQVLGSSSSPNFVEGHSPHF